MSTDSKFFDELSARVPEKNKIFIRHSLDIGIALWDYMERHGISEKDLADKLGVNSGSIVDWFGGMYNFDLRTISSIEAALGITLIATAKP